MSFDAGLRKKIDFFHDALQEKSQKWKCWGNGRKIEILRKRLKVFFFHKMLRLFSTNKVKVTFPEKSRNAREKVKKYITK